MSAHLPRRAVLLALLALGGCNTVEGMGRDIQAAFGGPRSDPETREIQALLHERGYDPGPIDGVHGSATASAIRAYERDRGLVVTGRPSPELLGHLRAEPAGTWEDPPPRPTP
jgi:peptidoglycan hydrolase-like protein with peptidoglycan-binding domain